MNDKRLELWAQYERTVGMLLPPLGPDDGDTEASLNEAEQRLGISLPALLRTFYLRTAMRKDINGCFNRLIPLGRVAIEQGHFLFYEENQAVCYWGIAVGDIAMDDPPVHRGIPCYGTPNWQWFQETYTLSGFLEMMLVYQRLSGGMSIQAAGGRVDVKTANQIYEQSEGWHRLTDPGHSGMRALWRDGQLLTLENSMGMVRLGGCGKTPEDLAVIASHFGIEWKRARES